MSTNAEVKDTLAALLNVDLTTQDLLIFFLFTICGCRLHVFVEKELKQFKKPAHMDKSQWDRCCKDNWRLTNHTYMCLASFLVLYRQDLLDLVVWPKNNDTRMWFTEKAMPLDARYLYIFHVANYIQDYICWAMVSPPAEVIMMNVHHVSSLIMLLASFVKPNNWAGGIVVMAVHEPCDILLAISKQFYYRSRNKLHINLAFLVFALSWVYFRLFVIACILRELWWNKTMSQHLHMLYCSYLLYVLWGMHLIWWGKIMRVLAKGWSGESLPDVRHDGFRKKLTQEAQPLRKEE